MDLQVKLSESSKRLINNFSKVAERTWLGIMNRAVKQVTEYVIGEGQLNITQNFKQRSGNLRRSLGISDKNTASKIEISGTGFSIHIGSRMVYAAIHEYGGDIYPKNAKALVFKVGDKTIFAQHVYIPPRPYLNKILSDKRSTILNVFNMNIMKGLHEALGI